MHRHFFAGLAAAALTLAPLTASAQSVGDLQSQIQTLLAQIAALTVQLATLPSATSTAGTAATATTTPPAVRCPTLGRTLAQGMSGEDVLSLQNFLSDQGELDGSSLTGYFGMKTLAALKDWQSSQGIAAGLGTVGQKTRTAISAMCGGRLGAPGLPSSSLTVGASTTALAVVAIANVNVMNACHAHTYTLDWGDQSRGVAIPIAEGSCASRTVTLDHSYAAPGYYTLTLASAPSQVTAHVNVGATAACKSPAFATTTSPTALVGASYSLPLITFAATDTSLTLVSTPLPTGLSLVDVQSSSAAGLMHTWTLAGTPSTAGASNITISANNDCGTAQTSFTLTVH
jgi:hypothetical protein